MKFIKTLPFIFVFFFVIGITFVSAESATGNITVTVIQDSCANGATNPPDCNNNTTSGTLSASPSSCTIAQGSSTCTTTLTLSITNPVTGAATNITKTGNTEVANGINPSSKPGIVVSYPSTTFYLNHNGATLGESTINAICTYGTSWNGSSCVSASALPSGVLSATNCAIALDQSACDTNISWNTLNPLDGATSAVTTTPPAGGNLVKNGNTSTATYSIGYGNTRTFFLYHNSVELAHANPTAICSQSVVPTIWNGSKCTEVTPVVCTLPEIRDIDTNTCVSPDDCKAIGKYVDGNTCVSACIAPKTTDEVNHICKSKSKFIFNEN